MGLFGKKEQGPAVPELVELRVGFDRVAASMVVARCEAEGIPIRLLTMDDHGLVPGLAALQEHRVLVRAEDRDQVERIVRQR